MTTKTLNGKEMFNEEWIDVKGYEGSYMVSSLGRIKSMKRVIIKKTGPCVFPERIWAEPKNKNVYSYLTLFKPNGEKKYTPVHRVVAENFIQNPLGKKQVNHKNGIKGDNRVENLEWATTSENIKHAYNTGLAKAASGERAANYGKYGVLNNFHKKCKCSITGRIMTYVEASRELSISSTYFGRMMNGIRKNNTKFQPLNPSKVG